MLSNNQSLSKPIKALLIIVSLVLIQLNAAYTNESYSFSIISEEICLKQPLTMKKTFSTFMASAKAEIFNYKNKVEEIFKQTEEAVKTWKIVKVETKNQTVSNSIVWPVKGKITSKFGMRIHPVTGIKAFHSGIDIRAKSGTNILCPTDGTVIDSGWCGPLGRMVRLKTQTGHVLCFGHLKKIYCLTGQKLSRGQVLGTVGSTGRVTGPHLHFTVIYNGEYINPLKYLSK